MGRFARPLSISLVVIVLATSCMPKVRSDEPSNPDSTPRPVTVTIPPERLTPFCQAMIDLSVQLVDDPPDDVTAAIVEAYTAIEPEVPAAIADDFGTVLAALRSGGATSATSPPPTGSSGTAVNGSIDEIVTGDTATERLNDFVDFTCRGIQNNPGAPATVPGPGPVGSDAAG